MSSSPIRREIGTVFIPVSDMERAVGWYSQLFGLPIQSTTHGGKIYNLLMLCQRNLPLAN